MIKGGETVKLLKNKLLYFLFTFIFISAFIEIDSIKNKEVEI